MDNECPENMGDNYPENIVESVAVPVATDTQNSIASKAMASGILVTAAPAITLAKTSLGAADEVLGTVTPIIQQGVKVLGTINSLTQFPDLNAKNTLSASIDNEAFKIASNQLLKNFEESNKNATSEKIAANLIKFISDKTKIETAGNQLGGKKIISRTHKSINQFLNSKITAANIKSKRFRSTKSKNKIKSKKRRKHY